MKKSAKNKEFVLTGQYLGVVEEFLPDKTSTFVKDGQIYATKTGHVSIDETKRQIVVKTGDEENRKTIEVGDVVIGTIVFLRKFSVGLNFFTINQKLHFNSSYFGNIHVSQISNRYVKKIKEAFQITDIIRAKVIKKDVNEYYLTTDGKDLGVIHADCVYCGSKLGKMGYNKLKCPSCGSVETRKIADDYGNVTEKLRY